MCLSPWTSSVVISVASVRLFWLGNQSTASVYSSRPGWTIEQDSFSESRTEEKRGGERSEEEENRGGEKRVSSPSALWSFITIPS